MSYNLKCDLNSTVFCCDNVFSAVITVCEEYQLMSMNMLIVIIMLKSAIMGPHVIC